MKIVQILLLGLFLVSLSECNRNRDRTRLKHKVQNKVKANEQAMIVTKNDKGQCIWGDLEKVTTRYPNVIKDRFKAVSDLCMILDANKAGTSTTCRTQQEILDQVANFACLQKTTLNLGVNDAIYYVNTRRLQKTNTVQIKKDFLNQFTFAVLPKDQDSILNYTPQLFSVVLAADSTASPYMLKNCPFDMSMNQSDDLKNDIGSDCYYKLQDNTQVSMKTQISDEYKKFLEAKATAAASF